MGIENLSTAELLFDRQECYNDLAVLAISKQQGITTYSGGNVDERTSKNLLMLDAIHQECLRRGFDAAQFDQVKRHFVTGGESFTDYVKRTGGGG